MSKPQETKNQSTLSEQAPAKKPYEKPQIICHAPLEAMASYCPPPLGKNQLECTGYYNSSDSSCLQHLFS